MTHPNPTNVAAILVADHLASCLPPNVPPSFQSISNARLAGCGKGRRAIANIIMFDGKPAQLEVIERDGMRSHRWISLEGGPSFFDGCRWQRESEGK